jgi:dTDP-glucose pyrophosphorylase
MPLDQQELAALCVSPQTSLYLAAEVLNGTHRRIVLVIDADGRLAGLVSDPDIRRAILARLDFNQPVTEIMARNPVVARPGDSPDAILELMERTHVHQIPLVDAAGRVTDVAFIEEVLARHRVAALRTAVIMAGGFGKRLLPLTEQTPKPLLPVGGRPILFTILDQLLNEGFNDIAISVNYHKDQIIDAVGAIDRYARHTRFVIEDEPLGTAGSLALLENRPSGPFIVVNGDVLTKVDFAEMVRFHRHERNLITMGLREERTRIPYGVVRLDGTRVTGIDEKPETVHHVNAGVYVIDPEVLGVIPKHTVYDMPTLIQDMISAKARVGCYPIHEYWLDVGQHPQLEQARQQYNDVFGDSDRNRREK